MCVIVKNKKTKLKKVETKEVIVSTKKRVKEGKADLELSHALIFTASRGQNRSTFFE